MAASDLARPTGKSLSADDATLSLVRATILVLVLLMAALLTWATLMPVKEAVVTAGQVVPSGNAQVVQHLEGGIVSSILVKEGDLVEAGQPLLVFDPKQVQAEREQMNARLLTLDLRAERLRAFAGGRAPRFRPRRRPRHAADGVAGRRPDTDLRHPAPGPRHRHRRSARPGVAARGGAGAV
ncbi:biotin/lipoyl-binding protein [Azospirillum melinis]|uniref:biotin/lipoyl-binding protein n=1 Tax=Azospirillum melinis TaxID=328839 RepID=UPI0037575997